MSKLKGKREPHELIQRVAEILEESGKKKSWFIDILIDKYKVETEDNRAPYIQRIYKLFNAEYSNLTDKEEKAIKAFIRTEENPHVLGSALMIAEPVGKKLNELQKAINSGYIDKVKLTKIIKSLKSLDLPNS